MRNKWQLKDFYPSFNGRDLKRIRFSDSDNVYLFGHKNGVVYRYHKTNGILTPLITIPDIGREILNLHVLENGNVLISTYSLIKQPTGRIYLYDFSSISVVLDFPVGWADEWSFTSHNNIVFIGEYGSKFNADNARRVYKSTDSGRTFTEVFQMPNVFGVHVHKVLYDPHTDKIWVSHGDNQDGIYYADGPNHTTPILSYVDQPTAGVVTENSIFWGSDSTVTGILKYDKITGQYSQVLDLRNTPYNGFIFDMRKSPEGHIYAATVGGFTGVYKIGVFESKAPLYNSWELIGEYNPPQGIGTYNGVRKIADASNGELVLRCYSGDGSQTTKKLIKNPTRKF